MRPFAIIVTALAVASHTTAGQHQLQGTVTGRGSNGAPIHVWAMKLRETIDRQLIPPTKQEIFAASVQPGNSVAGPNGEFTLALTTGHYCVFAFADRNRDGIWSPELPEPFGWHAAARGGGFANIDLREGDKNGIDIDLQAPRHFTKEARHTPGGSLCWINDYPVLQLRGDAKERGLAHGKLAADQIVDFFRFYILEDKFQSPKEYLNGFAKFLETHFVYPPQFVAECEAVIEGMKSSGSDLYLPELGRDFSLTDLYAINGYIETRAMRSSCTQFAAWGERTESTDVEGGMITGRNMDGEIDLRKVTVSHFLLFAVDPSEPDQKRYVSMMWPGFVATISGFNEEGFYAMENAGLTGPGKVVNRLVPIAWTMRESLARLGADATPASVQTLLDSFDNSAGGVCGPGCITLFAMPYHGQEHPAFVLEGDRFGDCLRLAGSARPRIPNILLASNHHRQYGVREDQPAAVFGTTPSFSSLWRYEAGMHKIESWHRTDGRIGTQEMRELLQTVAHGTTEYSIITRPNTLEFDVAVASMKAEPWDAPYRSWTTFTFEEVFAKAE